MGFRRGVLYAGLITLLLTISSVFADYAQEGTLREPIGYVCEIVGKGAIHLLRDGQKEPLVLTADLLKKKPIYLYGGEEFRLPDGSQAVLYYSVGGDTLRFPPLKGSGGAVKVPGSLGSTSSSPHPHGKKHWVERGGRHMNDSVPPLDNAPRLLCSQDDKETYIFVPAGEVGIEVAWVDSQQRVPVRIELLESKSDKPLFAETVEPGKVEKIECVYIYSSEKLAQYLRDHKPLLFRLRVVFSDGGLAQRDKISVRDLIFVDAIKADEALEYLHDQKTDATEIPAYFANFMQLAIENEYEMQAGAQMVRWWKRTESALAAQTLFNFGGEWQIPQLQHAFRAKLLPSAEGN